MVAQAFLGSAHPAKNITSLPTAPAGSVALKRASRSLGSGTLHHQVLHTNIPTHLLCLQGG